MEEQEITEVNAQLVVKKIEYQQKLKDEVLKEVSWKPYIFLCAVLALMLVFENKLQLDHNSIFMYSIFILLAIEVTRLRRRLRALTRLLDIMNKYPEYAKCD